MTCEWKIECIRKQVSLDAADPLSFEERQVAIRCQVPTESSWTV
jgi:hypothetical protein